MQVKLTQILSCRNVSIEKSQGWFVVNRVLARGPSIKYVRPTMAIFEPPPTPVLKQYALALPPPHKRFLVTHFQNTMNVK